MNPFSQHLYRMISATFMLFLSGLFVVNAMVPEASARLLFDNEFQIDNVAGNIWIIDVNDDATGDISLQFGNDGVPANNGTITWDISNTQFEIDNDVDFSQNEIKNLVIDNRAGVSPSTPVGGQMYYDSTDGNTYVRNAVTGQWEDVTDVNATLTKVVTVGTGLDYTTIAGAATYLNGLSGGIMLLAAETHSVTAAVDLSNVTLIGKDADNTIIEIDGAGQLDSFDTAFQNLTIDVNTLTTDDYAIDAQAGTSSLFFDFVDIDVADSGDSLIDSDAVTAPVITLKMVNCNQTGTLGTILKDEATGNIDVTSEIFVSSSSGNNLLQFEDWDVTIEGAGNVLTDGVISTIPDATIFVYPGMNLQGAVDSLTTGGYITLLPGTHDIDAPINVDNGNIQITGYGDASIINASGFSGITASTAAIQIGSEDGSSPVNGVTLTDFKLEIEANNIHGVRIAGGEDNQIIDVTVQKVSGTASDRSGIELLNSDAAVLARPVVTNSRVLGNGGSVYFTNGIEIILDTSTFGGTKGTNNALLDGNYVDFVGEDGYTLEGLESSSLFNNRVERMGVDGAATDSYGFFVSNIINLNMNSNLASSSQRTDAVGIGIETVDTGGLLEVEDSIFAANILDGAANSGSGFQYGFLIGNASNTAVDRISLQNNAILGASTLTTVAVEFRGNADDNSVANNDINGGSNAWNTGIAFTSATQERNLVRGNRPANVATLLSDGGTATQQGTDHHETTSDPTVNDDINDGYSVGTFWINTTNDQSYVLVDATAGAAVWNQIDDAAPTGATLDDAYSADSGERTIGVDDGDVSWDLTGANNFIVDIQGTGSISFQDAGVSFADFVDGGDVNLANNLTVGSSTETIANASFVLDGDDVFVADSLGVEGAIYSDAVAEKYWFLDIFGGVRGSAPAGTVAGGQSPVIRMEANDNSRVRYSFPVPDDWESGTDIIVDVFWSAADNTAGNVRYEFNYTSWDSGDTIAGGGFSDLFATEAASGTQLELQQVSFTMPAATFAADEMVNIRLNRIGGDAADTYGAEINVHAFRIRYSGKKLQ